MPLDLGEATPHTVRLTAVDGVLQAFLTDGACRADGLGVGRTGLRDGEEHGRIRVAAGGVVEPIRARGGRGNSRHVGRVTPFGGRFIPTRTACQPPNPGSPSLLHQDRKSRSTNSGGRCARTGGAWPSNRSISTSTCCPLEPCARRDDPRSAVRTFGLPCTHSEFGAAGSSGSYQAPVDRLTTRGRTSVVTIAPARHAPRS